MAASADRHSPLAALQPELLAIFVQVSRTLNFSKAAAQMHMAQPVVTRKMRQLEQLLGVELFKRTNRGCELTRHGAVLAGKAPALLLQLDQILTEVRNAGESVAGPISIGLNPTLASRLAPLLANAAASKYPLLRPTFVDAFTLALCKRLEDRELSMAVMYDPPPRPEFVVTPLLLERLHLVGAPGSPLSRMKTATLKDLVEMPLILPGRDQHVHLRGLIEDAFAEAGRPLIPAFEANSLGLLRSLASAGLGCIVLTVGSVAEEVAAGRLIAVPIAAGGLSVELAMVTTVEQARLRPVQLMQRLVANEVCHLASTGQWPGSPHVFPAASSAGTRS